MIDVLGLFNYLTNSVASLWNYLQNNPSLFIIVVPIVTLVINAIGKFVSGVSILQPFKELAYRQEKYRDERKLRKFNEKIALDYIKLGDSLLDISQFDQAKVAFEKAFSLDPVNNDAHMGILKSEIFQPIFKKEPTYYDRERTINYIKKILDYNGLDRHALYFLGEIHRDYDEKNRLIAKRYYNTVIVLYCEDCVLDATIPDKTYTFFKRIKLQLTAFISNIYHIAIKIFHRQPTSLQNFSSKNQSIICSLAKYGLAWIYLADGKEPSIVLESMQNIPKDHQENPVILGGLAYIELVNRKYGEAIEKLGYLIKSNPHIIVSHWDIIQAYRMLDNINYAYIYSQKLIKIIDDEDVFSLGSNRRVNLLEIDKCKVKFFKSIREKKCYSYYTVALTSYLKGHEKEAFDHLGKALLLDSTDTNPSKNVILYDIDCIKKAHVKYIRKLNIFKEHIEEFS